jgi:hypothetical protein
MKFGIGITVNVAGKIFILIGQVSYKPYLCGSQIEIRPYGL